MLYFVFFFLMHGRYANKKTKAPPQKGALVLEHEHLALWSTGTLPVMKKYGHLARFGSTGTLPVLESGLRARCP